ncbi:MAG: hypothetical protein WA366_05575 [Pseudolabrys sp.]|jgi:hypothetical protein
MMITKKDLALVADAVLRCGLASGSSVDEIIAFAKQTAPSKDPAWVAALTKVAKGKK